MFPLKPVTFKNLENKHIPLRAFMLFCSGYGVNNRTGEAESGRYQTASLKSGSS